jgi:hypothetical protein
MQLVSSNSLSGLSLHLCVLHWSVSLSCCESQWVPARMRTTSQLRYFRKPWPTRNGALLTHQCIHPSTNGASTLDPCLIGTKGCVAYLFCELLASLRNILQATPEGAKQGERFGLGMIGWGETIEAGAIVTGSNQKDWPTCL